METVTKKAWDPITEQEYEIKLPAESLVKEALLKFDYPPDGLHKTKIAQILGKQFALTDEQKNAKHKAGYRLFNYHVGRVTGVLIRSGKMVKLKSGWRGISQEQLSGQIRDTKDDSDDSQRPEESIEKNHQKIQEGLTVELLQKIKDNTPVFLRNSLLIFLLKWDMAAHARMPEKLLEAVVMVVLTVSLTKTGLVLMWFTFKPNAGKGM